MSTINPKIMKAVIAIAIFGIGSLVLVYGLGINIGGFGTEQIRSDGLTWDIKNTEAEIGLGKVVLDIDYVVVNPNDVPVTLDNAEIFIQYNGSKIGGVNVTKEIIESNSNKVISVQLSIDYFEAFGMEGVWSILKHVLRVKTDTFSALQISKCIHHCVFSDHFSQFTGFVEC